MNKRERLENLRREHARERQEIRDNEWDIRDAEDYKINMYRDQMAQILQNPELIPEQRKEQLANHKNAIEEVLKAREERELDFIEQELKRHALEAQLAQEIEEEEKANAPPQEGAGESLNPLFRVGPIRTLGAEQIRKNIMEKSKELTEDEQFSTILINTSDRDAIPDFRKSRRKREEPEQTARIDTIVIKQREIGIMYRESQELQKQHLNKSKKTAEPPPADYSTEISEEISEAPAGPDEPGEPDGKAE